MKHLGREMGEVGEEVNLGHLLVGGGTPQGEVEVVNAGEKL